MTSGSTSLDMIAIPGGTPAATISGIIAVEMKQPDTMTEPNPKAHGRPRHHHPTAPIGGQKILSGHSRIEAPTGGKRPTKVPIKPEARKAAPHTIKLAI